MEEEKKNQTENPNQETGAAPEPKNNSENAQNKREKLPTSPVSPFIPKGAKNKSISKDIESILKGAKLPERRSGPGNKNTEETQKRVFETTLETQKDRPDTEAPQKTPDITKKESDPKIKSLRTFKDDLQGLVKVKKMSLLKAATLENEKTRAQKNIHSDDGAKKKSRARFVAILFSIIVLVGLGVLALFVVLAIQGQRASDVPVVEDSSFLFSEQTFTLPITGQEPDDLINQMAGARSGVNLTLGAITRIVPTIIETDEDSGQQFEREAATAEFFTALNPQTPQDFVRSFDDSFFFGIHTIDENVPLIIIPVVLYQNAFKDMLTWERYMNEDLAPLFTKVPYQTIDPDGNISLNGFEDVIIRNYDVRALRDLSGNIRMLYAFPTKDILIVAESPHSFVEALSRLRAERRL
mgnify:CR=1 FL=1